MINKKTKEATSGVYATLYARSSDGRIKMWRIINLNNNIEVEYGFINSKARKEQIAIPVSNRGAMLIDKIYNIILRRIKNKRKEGYVFIEEIPGNNLSNLPKFNTDQFGRAKVMLANRFKMKNFNKLERYSWLWQIKYNGVRCTAEEADNSDVMLDLFNKAPEFLYLSKEGIEYNPSILNGLVYECLEFLKHEYSLTNFKLDGELYIHGKTLDEIRKHIPYKNSEMTSFSIPSNDPNLLNYIIYDILIEDVSQFDRHLMLVELEAYINSLTDSKNNVFIDPGKVLSIKEALKASQEVVNKGFEGGIIRRTDATYKFGSRTSMMLKIKFEEDAEFEILDIINYGEKGGMMVVKVIMRNDKTDDTFEVTPGDKNNPWTAERKLELFNNKDKYIGKMGTVSFYDRSSYGLPQHCNFITVRDYE
jgi:ATP-dependent DNA ligase